MRPAAEEILDAFQFYESREVDLGARFMGSVVAALNRLSAYPESASVLLGTVRKMRVARFPYSFLFSVEEATIHVLAVMHDSRDPKRWNARH